VLPGRRLAMLGGRAQPGRKDRPFGARKSVSRKRRRPFTPIGGARLAAGLAWRLDTPAAAAEPYFERIDVPLLFGTAPEVKGQDLASDATNAHRSIK
jgi:hypothetical protein